MPVPEEEEVDLIKFRTGAPEETDADENIARFNFQDRTLNFRSIKFGLSPNDVNGKADATAVTETLKGYAKKSDIPTDYLTESDKTELQGNIDAKTTMSEVEAKGYITEADLDGYATTSFTESNYQPKGNYLTESDKTELQGKIDAKTTMSDVEAKGYITTADLDGYATTSFTESQYQPKGDYAVTGDIPTSVSQLTNDAGYITEASIPTKLSEFTNDTNFITTAATVANANKVGGKTPAQISAMTNNTNLLTNGAGFITKSVDNLDNYYTKDSIDSLMSSKLERTTASTLPTTGAENTIYMIPKSTAGTQDAYDEYMYISSKWEHIGSSTVDLSNYYKKTETSGKTEISTALAGKSNTGHTHVSADITDALTASNTTTHLDWGAETSGKLVTNSYLAYWNGAYNSGGSSNLAYCNKGAFGTMATANTTSYSSATQVNTALGKKSDTGHTHDDRYYTETEVDTKLSGKSNTGHTHDDRYYTETEINTKLSGKSDTGHTHVSADITDALTANAITHLDWPEQSGNVVTKSYLAHWNGAYNSGNSSNLSYCNKGAFGSMATRSTSSYSSATQVNTALAGKSDTGHTHDDRYYTETEINTKLSGKSDTGHTHDDRYYTETEVDTKLGGKSDTGHTHAYLPLSGGTMTGGITGFAGATQLVTNTASALLAYKNTSATKCTDGSLFGTKDAPSYLRSSADNLYHYNANKDANYKILDAGNSAHTHSYLPLSGGTMTGAITFGKDATSAIKYEGTKSTQTLITFIDNTGDAYGNGIRIGGGGATIIGGGESAAGLASDLLSSGGNERMIIGNDTSIEFWSNCNTIANKISGTFDTSGCWNGQGFKKSGSSDSYVLLGGGGHKELSKLSAEYLTPHIIGNTTLATASPYTYKFKWATVSATGEYDTIHLVCLTSFVIDSTNNGSMLWEICFKKGAVYSPTILQRTVNDSNVRLYYKLNTTNGELTLGAQCSRWQRISNIVLVCENLSGTGSPAIDKISYLSNPTATDALTDFVEIGVGGRTKYADIPTGFGSKVGGGWGKLNTNNGYTITTGWNDGKSGEIIFANKSTKLYAQIDGEFYQNEGQNKVLDEVNYSAVTSSKTQIATALAGKSGTDHIHSDKLSLSGGTMTGSLKNSSTDAGNKSKINSTSTEVVNGKAIYNYIEDKLATTITITI